MIPVSFPGQNIVFGKDRPQYRPLPALDLEDENGEVITCWEISEEELQVITRTRRIYLSQYTFNRPLQPILPMADLSDKIEFL